LLDVLCCICSTLQLEPAQKIRRRLSRGAGREIDSNDPLTGSIRPGAKNERSPPHCHIGDGAFALRTYYDSFCDSRRSHCAGTRREAAARMSEYLDIGAGRKRKRSGHQEKIMRVRKTCDAKDCDYADCGSLAGDTDSSHGRCVLSEGA
jgi:hypothetical protein